MVYKAGYQSNQTHSLCKIMLHLKEIRYVAYLQCFCSVNIDFQHTTVQSTSLKFLFSFKENAGHPLIVAHSMLLVQ